MVYLFKQGLREPRSKSRPNQRNQKPEDTPQNKIQCARRDTRMSTCCRVAARPQVHQLRQTLRLCDDEGAEAVAHVARISDGTVVARESGAPVFQGDKTFVVAKGVVGVAGPDGTVVFDDVDACAVAGAADASMQCTRVCGNRRTWLQPLGKFVF